jgi:hypothetical protein
MQFNGIWGKLTSVSFFWGATYIRVGTKSAGRVREHIEFEHQKTEANKDCGDNHCGGNKSQNELLLCSSLSVSYD